MAYIGRTPTGSILTSADIADGSISTAKLADDAVDNTKRDLADTYAFTGTVSGAGSPAIGEGQSWSNVIGSRSANTTYTNSTGKPIEIVIGVFYKHLEGLGGNPTLNIDGNNMVYVWSTASGGTQNRAPFIAIIPDESTYRINISGTAESAINYWWELR